MQISISFLLTEIPTFCIVAADLTERIEAEESLRRANEELDIKVKERTSALARSNAELQQFAYVASHDLQEPLRMVTAYLSLLEKKYGDVLNGQAREYMDFAIEGGIRARQLVSDLLELSHLESQAKHMCLTA
jgi:light-regulated signal transduction histidine kinase (bacteriophytochrome)